MTLRAASDRVAPNLKLDSAYRGGDGSGVDGKGKGKGGATQARLAGACLLVCFGRGARPTSAAAPIESQAAPLLLQMADRYVRPLG